MTGARLAVGLGGLLLVGAIMWDAFEAIVLPRRVTRALRPTRWFYRSTWLLWRAVGVRIRPVGRRETYLSYYGPLSLFLLLTGWASMLVLGFAMVQWAIGSRLAVAGGVPTFADDLYLSGTSFFTLGLGDVAPLGALARVVTVIEAGTGFGFLALVIGYFPVLYQAFSHREVSIALLDARAGSPPSAGELLRRHAREPDALGALLADWERWCAELLESHLSYPVLSYYRSQHDNQSWLAALTTILDASALVTVAVGGHRANQARLTFAIARHAVVDLTQVLGIERHAWRPDRLPPQELAQLREMLAASGIVLPDGPSGPRQLARLRRLYEPYVVALGEWLLAPLPPWSAGGGAIDNWRATAWRRPGTGPRPRPGAPVTSGRGASSVS